MSNPAPHPGERLASYFEKFFTTVVGVATLGASLSFARIVQTPVEPWIDYGVTTVTIQIYRPTTSAVRITSMVRNRQFKIGIAMGAQPRCPRTQCHSFSPSSRLIPPTCGD